MPKPTFEFDEKVFHTQRSVKDKITLSKKDFGLLLEGAQKFIADNAETCQKTPRMWNKGDWQKLTFQFLSENGRGKKFWSTTREHFDKEDGLVWSEDKERIGFLAFMVLKQEIPKMLSSYKRKKPGSEEAEQAAPKKTKATSKSKADAKPKATPQPKAVVNDSESENENGSDGNGNETDGSSDRDDLTGDSVQVEEKNFKIHKGDPFVAARAVEKAGGQTEPGMAFGFAALNKDHDLPIVAPGAVFKTGGEDSPFRFETPVYISKTDTEHASTSRSTPEMPKDKECSSETESRRVVQSIEMDLDETAMPKDRSSNAPARKSKDKLSSMPAVPLTAAHPSAKALSRVPTPLSTSHSQAVTTVFIVQIGDNPSVILPFSQPVGWQEFFGTVILKLSQSGKSSLINAQTCKMTCPGAIRPLQFNVQDTSVERIWQSVMKKVAAASEHDDMVDVEFF